MFHTAKYNYHTNLYLVLLSSDLVIEALVILSKYLFEEESVRWLIRHQLVIQN